jgi:uncharacterized damage-inducible protein DinB
VNEVLLDAFRHNNWATKSLIGFCREQGFTAEQLEVTGVGTYGGILATLEHIIGADRSYLSRLAEEPLAPMEDVIDFDRLEVWNDEAGVVWEGVLANPIEVERVIVVDNGTRETRADIFLAQALNHANHHREQVCAILIGFGIEPPDIQAWEYAWQTNRIWDRETPAT